MQRKTVRRFRLTTYARRNPAAGHKKSGTFGRFLCVDCFASALFGLSFRRQCLDQIDQLAANLGVADLHEGAV